MRRLVSTYDAVYSSTTIMTAPLLLLVSLCPLRALLLFLSLKNTSAKNNKTIFAMALDANEGLEWGRLEYANLWAGYGNKGPSPKVSSIRFQDIMGLGQALL